MPKRSAGLLPYRVTDEGTLEVFIVHPGGPLWSKKDDHVWSVAKGEHGEGDDPAATAEREFREETGREAPPGPRIDLGELRQASGKRVRVWALAAATLDSGEISSNTFQLEWPPRSGRMQTFPEVDRAGWFSAPAARVKLVGGQVGFVDRLTDALNRAGVEFSETGD
jgi:predicted NUDIX family NTP pyrophosphohydrolase